MAEKKQPAKTPQTFYIGTGRRKTAVARVRLTEGGVELLGRLPGAAPRGCSIAADEMLGRA